jgi:hypothetical protein
VHISFRAKPASTFKIVVFTGGDDPTNALVGPIPGPLYVLVLFLFNHTRKLEFKHRKQYLFPFLETGISSISKKGNKYCFQCNLKPELSGVNVAKFMAPSTSLASVTPRQTSSTTNKLARTPLWQTFPEFLPIEERFKLTYERAKSIVQHYSKITSTCRIHLTLLRTDS